MPQLGIIFEISRAHTVSGEGIRVVGNVPELGAWDPDAASALRAGVTTYPRWIMSAPLWLEVRESEAVERPPQGVACAGADSGARAERYVVLEYKYLKERAALGQPVLWEDAIPNRRVALPFPADGGRSRVWHVSDDAWNSAAGSTRIVPTTLGEVLSTRETLDPEEAARMRRPGATWIPQLETQASRASSPVREATSGELLSARKYFRLRGKTTLEKLPLEAASPAEVARRIAAEARVASRRASFVKKLFSYRRARSPRAGQGELQNKKPRLALPVPKAGKYGNPGDEELWRHYVCEGRRELHPKAWEESSAGAVGGVGKSACRTAAVDDRLRQDVDAYSSRRRLLQVEHLRDGQTEHLQWWLR
eukprot:TRINITY_DN4600_c0_g1_i1.p1 TRINITY_DN4600_c0_g1~~TRINITY_DN4600_c0_g1_i1.p1  ORF type:complete len:365 (-),score=60.85 TRINITY_DN4600_c0_g1_i1:441-1535(-)